MLALTARVTACLTVVFVIADVAVTAAYSSLFSEEAVAVHGFPFTQLAVLGSALLGAVILSRYERHAVGVLLSLIGVLSSFSLVTEAYRTPGTHLMSAGVIAACAVFLFARARGRRASLAVALLALLACSAPWWC